MFLKKIILKNFKSFIGKNVLEFPYSLTAIVGPNGSGKSNIVDALRWALGEQKNKNIRINQGTDVIFAGNNKEPSAGFAEVELIFDNSSRIFSLDYSEVSVSRRIDKDGNSNYYLNHQACRLKDIIQLSARAKLGLLGLAIINQGAIENILRTSPLELRMMIEENIGLKELELKKDESQRKIINSINNLKEAEARDQEITPHYHSLKRQVKRWQQRKEIQQNLQSLERVYFASSLQRFLNTNQGEQKDQSSILKDVQNQINNLRQEISQEKQELQNQPQEPIDIKAITQDLFALQQKKISIEAELNRKLSPELETNLSNNELRDILDKVKERLVNLLKIQEVQELVRQIQEIIKYLTNALKPKVQKPIQKPDHQKNQRDELLKLTKAIQAKNKLLQDYQQKSREQNIYYQNKLAAIEKKRTQIEKLLEQEQSLRLNQERLRLFLEEWEQQVTKHNFSPEEIKVLAKKSHQLSLADNEFRQLESKIEHLRRVMDEIGEEDQTIIDEYHDIEERYQFLTKQINDLQVTIKDLQSLKNKLEGEIEDKFTQALNDINLSFNKYFRDMFQGGEARLERIRLTNNKITEQDDKEFAWGIVLKIKIPKVKNSHIEMLSGGEKTLVAIALMFALVHQSTPPLLVMDEIDAALDEENSRRFAETLHELSKKTQFIVITHDRLTMQSASIIYGVTADERGVSKLLSIKLEEAEDLINQNK